jgi:hypothetical protein
MQNNGKLCGTFPEMLLGLKTQTDYDALDMKLRRRKQEIRAEF